jgi:hypothetical protein
MTLIMEIKSTPIFQTKKYVGWLSKYDSWRSSTCASIHPQWDVVTPYCCVDKNRMDVNNFCNDKTDALFLTSDQSEPIMYCHYRKGD